MKLSFIKFKHLVLESIFSENKSHLIRKLVLPDIEDENKKEAARKEIDDFFKSHSNFEKMLDWNKNNLSKITYSDFEKIKRMADNTKGAQKREIKGDIKAIFKNVLDRKFEIVGENDEWLFVAPLTYEAAIYCDSSENQGAGAKWCIGKKDDDSFWDEYVAGDGSVFIMAFNKNYKSLDEDDIQDKLKFMIEYTKDNQINVWNQSDKKSKDINRFNINENELVQMFSKVRELYAREKENEKASQQDKLKQKIDALQTVNKIPDRYFSFLPIKIKDEFEKIEIPNNIERIGEKAFYGCYRLKSVKIPESVVEIQKEAFAYCKFPAIRLPKKLDKIEYGVFTGCHELETITIPNGVTFIGEIAFYDCKKLKNIILPNGLTTIGGGAFQECESLESITIPESVTFIGEYAFYYCKKLKEIIFNGKTLKEIKSMKHYGTWETNISKFIKPGK